MLRVAVPVAVVLVIVVLVMQGANRPADPYFGATAPAALVHEPGSGATASSPEHRVPVPGFGEVAFRVDASNAAFAARTVARRCALLAATETQRTQGLMGRSDLSGYDGMLFRHDSDLNLSFVMTDTIIPLTVAFFDSDGRFISSTDMVPCLAQPCPGYPPPRPYRMAMEVPQGRLPSLGIESGSRLVVEANSPTC